jgi:DNA (cytosine-5)-methyltransferase 1
VIKEQLISISLFSGGFGLDIGMEQAGFKTVSVVEKDVDATKTIAKNRGELKESAVPRDIREVKAKTLLEEGGRMLGINRAIKEGEIDVITGGPPCQPFSIAGELSGKRKSFSDPRGNLFIEYARIIKEIEPSVFVMENVKGLLFAAIRPQKKEEKDYLELEEEEKAGTAFKVILRELKNIGYKVEYKLLEAANYGVPQSRERVIIIGSKLKKRIEFPMTTHNKKGRTLFEKPCRTVRDALSGLVEVNPEFKGYSEKRLKYLSLLKEGECWKHLPKEMQKEAMGGADTTKGGSTGFYRRLAWDKPSPTITTSPSQKATDMCHPAELRPLSVRECARIQTFPDEWEFHGSVASKYRQIGNAVPPLLAYAIGKEIEKTLKNK